MSAIKKPLTFDIDRAPSKAAAPATEIKEARQQVGARIKETTYRRLKAKAAMQGEKVQDMVERAIEEFLANHQDYENAGGPDQ